MAMMGHILGKSAHQNQGIPGVKAILMAGLIFTSVTTRIGHAQTGFKPNTLANESMAPAWQQQSQQYRQYGQLIWPWFVLARQARQKLNTFDPSDPNTLQHWAAFYQEWQSTSGRIYPYLKNLPQLPISQYRSYQALQTLDQQLATYLTVLQQSRQGYEITEEMRLEAAEHVRQALEQWLSLESLYQPIANR